MCEVRNYASARAAKHSNMLPITEVSHQDLVRKSEEPQRIASAPKTEWPGVPD